MNYLLTKLPKHCDEDGNIDTDKMNPLLPWVDELPECCKNKRRWCLAALILIYGAWFDVYGVFLIFFVTKEIMRENKEIYFLEDFIQAVYTDKTSDTKWLYDIDAISLYYYFPVSSRMVDGDDSRLRGLNVVLQYMVQLI